MLTSVNVLMAGVRDAIREQAKSSGWYERQENSLIEITLTPHCQEADDWLGGLSFFDDEGAGDAMSYTHAFSMHPSVVKDDLRDALFCATTAIVPVYSRMMDPWCDVRLRVFDVLDRGESREDVNIIVHTREQEKLHAYFDRAEEVIADFFRNEREDFAIGFACE